MASYVGLDGGSWPRAFRMRNGDVVTLENMHDLTTVWIMYCRREYTVLRQDRIIVDVGANIGAFTLFAARRAPDAKIVAVEPFPGTRARLAETVEKNGLRDRVAIRAWALAGLDSTRAMDDRDGPSQSRGMLPTGVDRGLAVDAVSLATLLDREGLSRVDLLKMDIEGGEHEVFAGASFETLRRIERISLEYHPGGSKARLFERLKTAGFALVSDAIAAQDSGVAEFQRGAEPR